MDVLFCCCCCCCCVCWWSQTRLNEYYINHHKWLILSYFFFCSFHHSVSFHFFHTFNKHWTWLYGGYLTNVCMTLTNTPTRWTDDSLYHSLTHSLSLFHSQIIFFYFIYFRIVCMSCTCMCGIYIYNNKCVRVCCSVFFFFFGFPLHIDSSFIHIKYSFQ